LRHKENKHRGFTKVPTKSRPSRRSPEHLGRRRTHELSMVVVIDTSASMSDNILKELDAELKAICQRNARITVIHADCNVAKIEQYEPRHNLEKFFGRGGTDFNPAFKAITQMRPLPHLAVYFTDGAGTPMQEDYGVDTLWVLTPNSIPENVFKSTICNWGDVIKITGETHI
jgi:predicted metal-dependent peptidase